MTEDEYAESLWAGWEEAFLPTWLDLFDLLKDRLDWRFETTEGDAGWDFGLGGARRLSAIADGHGVTLHVWESDTVKHFATAEFLSWWLDEHEEEFAGASSSPARHASRTAGNESPIDRFCTEPSAIVT